MNNKKTRFKKLLTKIYIANFIVLSFLLLSFNCYSQGAAINSNGATADGSAMLDVSSNNSGILIPRMTKSQKNSISSPATGLMIYQIDDTTGFWYHNGTIWKQVGEIIGGGLPVGNNIGNTLYWDGNQWVNSYNIYNNGVTVGIGTNNPDASAAFEINNSAKGTLITRMTTIQRNAINNPAVGLQIFNTTTNCLEIFIAPIWQNIYCGCSSPSAPIAGTNNSTPTEITWNWNSSLGATGYKYNTINNYNSAIDNGTNTTFTQTLLTSNTSYTLFVWAYNACGYSSETTLSYNTASAPWTVCGDNISFGYNGTGAPLVTYGTIYKGGKCWLDRNLGANSVATAYNDSDAYGDLFQWGRLDDGHQKRLSLTISVQSTVANPGHSSFIVGYSDWISTQNNSLWQGTAGINNPCPTDWRLPTMTEIDNERASWNTQNYLGAFNSTLKLTAPGRRTSNGTVEEEGSYAYYWSSTVSGNSAYNVYFLGSSALIVDWYNRSFGFSVRCLKD